MSFILYIIFLILLILGLSDITDNLVLSILSKILFISIPILLISYLTIKKFHIVVNFLTIWFGLQRFVALMIASIPVFSVEIFRTFFLIKEVFFIYIFILLGIVFILNKNRIKIQTIDKYLIIFCTVLLLYMLFSHSNIWVRILSLRRFIILPLVYAIGRLALVTQKNIQQIIKFTIIFAFILCIYGLTDYFIARDFIYLHLFNIDEYFSKQVEAGFIPIKWTLGNVMQGGIFVDYTWGALQRFVTTYIEPTTLGSFLAFCMLYATFYKKAYSVPQINNIKPAMVKLFSNIILFLCIFLTFSKGALIIFATGTAFILYFNEKIPLIIRRCFLIGVGGVIVIMVLYLLFANTSGASAHINGLISGVRSGFIHPFGLGLGNAGNYVQMAELDTSEVVGVESTVGCMLGQLGIIGYLPYLIFLITLITTMSTEYARLKNINYDLANLSLTTAGAFLGYTVNSLFTDSASGVTGNFYYFLLAGLVVTKLSCIKQEEIKQ